MHIDQDLEGEPLARMGLTWLFNSVPFVYLGKSMINLACSDLFERDSLYV